MNATSRRVSRAPSRAALGVAAAALVAFLPSLFCGFVYDDVLLISENPYAQSTAYLARAFRTHLWDVYSFGEEGIGLRYYRPLVSISYIANWLLGGGGAWAFHLFNALLHAAATFLAVRVAARWTGSVALGVVAGLLFALHPTRTESVIWIAGRTDLMMAVFSLGAIELAHAGAKAEPRRAWLLNVLAALSTVGATLSKEAGALTGLLILVDAALLSAGSRERRRLIALAAGLALLGACYIAGRGLFYPVRPKQEVLFESTPAYGLMTVWSYVERTVFPWPQTFFYRPIEARGGQPWIPASLTVLGALAVVGYGVLVAWALRRDRVAGLLLIAAVVLLGPLLNFSYTGIFVTTSDHFLYLPLLLLTAGVLRLAAAPLGSWMEIRAVQLAFGGILVTYLGVDALRALDYRGDETLFSHEISVEPNNPFALNSVAILRARDGELAEAEALLERAQSPEATRFFLLATPAARAGTYIRQLALRAALTPDGDVRSLDLIFSELDALSRGRSGSRTGNAGSLKVGLTIDADVLSKILTKGGRFGLFADAAVVGARWDPLESTCRHASLSIL